MDIKGIGRKDVEWINMAQNREKWRDVVNTVIDHYCICTVHVVDHSLVNTNTCTTSTSQVKIY